MPTNQQIDWNLLAQNLASANQMTGGYTQSVNPSWNNYTQTAPFTTNNSTTTTNSSGNSIPGLGALSGMGPLGNIGALSSLIGNGGNMGPFGGNGPFGVNMGPFGVNGPFGNMGPFGNGGPMGGLGSLFGNGGRQVTNAITIKNGEGQSPTQLGNYYGVPVYDPASGQISSSTKKTTTDHTFDFLDPAGLFGSLFGGPKSTTTWNPYIQNGQYYFADPSKQNPVPVASVPGATLKPDKTSTQSANNTQALVNLLPSVQNAVAGQAIPQQQAQLAAAQATSGPYADLMTRLYAAYGPVLNSIGNTINYQNQAQGASNQASVFRDQGPELAQAGLSLMRQINPEYFNSRALTGAGVNNLVGNAMSQLGGGLSPTEYRAIQQGLTNEGNQRGTVNAPSMTDIIANERRYGQAGYNRNIQSQNQLSQAIYASNPFMQQSQVSGFNPVAQVTGSNLSNPGAANFTGVNNAGQNAFGTISGMADSLGKNVNNLQQQTNQIDQQNKLQNSWQNILGTVSGAIGNIGSAI